MKINLNKIYVGNIMVSDSYSVDEDGFGDYVRPRNTGHLDQDGQFELMILFEKTYGGEIYLPVKWVKCEHQLSVISKAVENFVASETSSLDDKYKNVILRPVVHSVGGKYVTRVKPVFPSKKGSMYLREAKALRDKIKQLAYSKGIIKDDNCKNTSIAEIEGSSEK